VVAWHEAGTLRGSGHPHAVEGACRAARREQFAQVHRSVIVNLSSIARVVRGSKKRRCPSEGPRRSTAGESQLPAFIHQM